MKIKNLYVFCSYFSFYRNVIIIRYNVGEYIIGIVFYDYIIFMLIIWGYGMGIGIDGDLIVKNIIFFFLIYYMVN